MNEITIKLTDEEFGIVQECIEYISANERSFDKEHENILKSVAEKFNAEYIEDANLNYDNWHENEDINLKLKILENENDELKHKLRQARKLLMLSKKECIYNGDEFQTEYRIKCNDFIGEIKCYEMENKGE